MGFCFKRKESVQKAINRLGRERMAHALKALKDCRQAEAVHRVRKDIKKARALLVMVRSDIEGKMFRRQIKALREAAGQLSDLRDAFVVTSALKTLSRHFTHQLAGHAVDQLRGPLTQNLHDEMRRFSQGRTDLKVARALRSATKGFDRLTLHSKGWAALGPGLKSTYSRARQAYRTAQADASPENLHEWRKRAKELWYEVRMLSRIWPEQMDAIRSELKALGEYLGDDHDLVMLHDAVTQTNSAGAKARQSEMLSGLIRQRRAELEAVAFALGARFFAEPSSVFCGRLRRYWHIWRREKKKTRAKAQLVPR